MVCLMILQSLASTFFATLCKNIKVHDKNLVKDEEKLCSKIPKPEMDVHNPSLIHLNTFMYSFIHVRIIQPQILTLISLMQGGIFRFSQASKIYLISRLLFSKYYSIIYYKMSCTWTKCSDERHLLEPRELLRIQEQYSTYMNECNEL